ncbi:WD40 repeat-like protein [Suillus brevipes Sb2]|nr:WD40 repeat-like protein [Suillus brevipes Sb2]
MASDSTKAAATKSILTPSITLKGHGGWIRSISHLPDGQRIIGGSRDATARQWDLKAGKDIEEAWDVLNPETNIMDAPTMHNSLATMPLRKTEVDHLKDILCLPDGKRIIVHSWDGSFRVRDLETGTQVGGKWEDEDWGVKTMHMVSSPDGKKVASGSDSGGVKLWSVDTGKVIKTWTGHTKRVNSLRWSPDGERVVSGSKDKTFRVWDVESGKTIIGPINTGDNRDDLHQENLGGLNVT